MVKHGKTNGPVEAGSGNLQGRSILLQDSNICFSQTTCERNCECGVNFDSRKLLDLAPQQICA